MKSPQEIIYLSSSYRISILFYGLAITCLTSATVSASCGGNETDYHALLSFKSKITHDPYKVLTSWNHSFHFCDWSVISCGTRHKRVTVLRLKSQGLEASLLRHLYLSRNKFCGVIPVNLSGCSNLEDLWLSQNNLAGSIPKEMSLLSKLSLLVISKNNLTGGIPTFLGNITSMESLPSEIGNQLPNLEFLQLRDNVPPSLSNCSKLGYIEMANNNFSGKLTIDFSKLRDINIIRLQNNNFHGRGETDDM
ncbi:kinase-like domain-containing protein, partial [Tanacetum coccineum]